MNQERDRWQRIEERLRQVELSLSELQGQLRGEGEHLSSQLADIQRLLAEHARLLVGQNGASLVTRLAVLEEKEAARRWSLRAVWTAVIGMLVKLVFDYL